MIRTPLVTPGLSGALLALISPRYGRVARALVDSLRNETVVHTSDARTAFPIQPRGLRDAIERALVEEDARFAQTRWSDALASASGPPRLPGASVGWRRVSSRVVRVKRPAADAFEAIQRIGGATGWYAIDWFWRVRGWLDVLRGGAGLRRGRRDPSDLRVGDLIDFWRVERLERGRLLRLAAEMRIPGRLWLQFEVDHDEGGGAQIRQTTVFDPAGYAGRLYWYVLCPVHQLVFGSMLRGLARALARSAMAKSHDRARSPA
jgi:hypothetical protein